MPANWWKPALAELVGTFIFFCVGIGAIMTAEINRSDPGVALLTVAAAHGLILAIMVSAFGRISGGKFNPAVSIGVWLAGKNSVVMAVIEIVAQLLGGVLAGLVMFNLIYGKVGGIPAVAAGVSPTTAWSFEILATFFLVTVVLMTAVDKKNVFNAIAGFGIGLTVFVDILVGGPLTGAAMNPARYIGPAIAAGDVSEILLYTAAPIVGGIIAAVLYRFIFSSDLETSS